MVNVKAYLIKVRKPGRLTYDSVSTIYATNWYDACKEFKKWALSWLEDMSNDRADELAQDMARTKYPCELQWDGAHYTIKKV